MKRSHLLVALGLALALALRLWQLGEVPPGFNQDEAANAFDPLSLWHTGETYTGDAWPLFFDMYGDYNEGLYYYLNLPFYVAFGNAPAHARLPIALVGALCAVLLYFAVKQVRPRSEAVLAAALLAVSPWAILLSRIALREMLLPACWLAGLGFFLRAVRHGRSLLPATVCFALAFYSYTPVRLFLPPMLLLLAALWGRELWRKRTESVVLNAIAFAVLVAPFAWWIAFRMPDLLARSESVDVFEPGKPVAAALAEFARGWLSHYDPRYLFLAGGHEPLFVVPGWGLLHLWTAPFVLAGLARSLVRRSRWDGLLVGWLAFYPLADAFTMFAPHPHRAVVGVGLYEIFAAEGIVLAVAWLAARRRAWAWGMSLFLVLLAALGVSGFARDYFGKYPDAVERINYRGVGEILKSPHMSWRHGVVVTERMHRGSMQVFYHHNLWGPARMEEDPGAFPMRLGRTGTRWPAPDHFTWGCFAFGNPFLLDYPGALYVLHAKELGLLPALDVSRDRHGATLWALVSDEVFHAHAPWLYSGSPALRLVDAEISRGAARPGELLTVRCRVAVLREIDPPLAWATHFFSGNRLWPHDIAFPKGLRAGDVATLMLETMVPEGTEPGTYQVFAGPYIPGDARLPNASGGDFCPLGEIVIESGSPEKSTSVVWERDGQEEVVLRGIELSSHQLRRGEKYVLHAELVFPRPLAEPCRLELSFFTHGTEWRRELWLARGRSGTERLEIRLRVPRNAVQDEYSFHAGLYDPAREVLRLTREGHTRRDLDRLTVR